MLSLVCMELGSAPLQDHAPLERHAPWEGHAPLWPKIGNPDAKACVPLLVEVPRTADATASVARIMASPAPTEATERVPPGARKGLRHVRRSHLRLGKPFVVEHAIRKQLVACAHLVAGGDLLPSQAVWCGRALGEGALLQPIVVTRDGCPERAPDTRSSGSLGSIRLQPTMAAGQHGSLAEEPRSGTVGPVHTSLGVAEPITHRGYNARH